MTFDIRQLQAFVTVLNCGSLGRAAGMLHVTQPALSRTVRNLEEQLGAPLFERHSKGMHLTEVGETLLPHAVSILQGSTNAKQEIDAMLGLARGVVRIGTISSASLSVLPLLINEFSTKYPKIQIQVIEDVWDSIADSLMNNKVDIAFGIDTHEISGLSKVEGCSWSDVTFLVSGSNHPLREKGKANLAEILDQKWVTAPRGTPPYQSLSRIFLNNGLPMPNIVVETRSSILMKSLVAKSGFLSWMPSAMYSLENKAGLISALDIKNTSEKFNLFTYRRKLGILSNSAIKILENLRLIISNKEI